MTILLVHGWGYHAGVWDGVADRLHPHGVQRADLGYFSQAHIPSTFDAPVVAVGHSLGVLWLLSQADIPMKGLVSIAGFDNFAAHVRPALLKAMAVGLRHAPERTLRDFWATGGAEPFCDTQKADIKALMGGLEALGSWDGRAAHEALSCPVLALAARDDKIVPEAMTKAIWPEKSVKWVESGNHALPLTQTEWCAREILDFADTL